MKKDRIYIVLLVCVFAAFVLVEYYAPQPIDWSPSFSKKDKIPYGAFITYDCLQDIFPGKKIETTSLPVYNTLADSIPVNTNYIIVNADFSPDTLDAQKMLDYVEAGNNFFIAVEDYTGPLADSLKVKTGVKLSILNNAKDSVSLNFDNPAFHSAKDFVYRKGTVDYYFTNYDTAHTEVLGKNSLKQPNYIKIKRGKGSFYLSAVPMAFTNYNAIKGNNAEYIFRSLSFMPVNNTWWDENYKINKVVVDTPLRYILNNKALKYAYYLLIFMIIVYVLFEGKRKQRAIPVILPLENTSLEFVETIGLLYYQKGTDIGIAKKKIQFFLEHLRSLYNIAGRAGEEEYCISLAQKSGVSEEEVKKLFTFISKVNERNTIDENTLIELNNKIEDFYKKTN